MTLISQTKSLRAAGAGMMIFALALAGCKREQVTVQDVPKDADAPARPLAQSTASADASANPHAGMDMGMSGMNGGALPQAKWTLPAGWQEKQLSEMRVGSFNAPGKDGQSADVSIIPLPSGGPQMELANLNMWRGELQLPPATKAESEPVTIAQSQGKLFEIADGKAPGRIIVAELDRDGMSWYFKMRGDDATVKEQKPAFLEFLKSISFEAAPAASTAMTDPHAGMSGDASAAAAQPAANAGVPLPAGWTQVSAPSQFLLAKYDVQGADGAKAEVNVSALAGQGGGLMMNVNRWRGQLGLSPVSEEDFSKQAQTVAAMGGQATMVDMTGTDSKTGKKARLIGVIAPQAGETWFFKLMGDEQVVEQQKEAFTKFIQTAKFENQQ